MASIKTMLLGIIVMLFGGILVISSSGSAAGADIFFALVGLMLGVFGFFRKD